ncbi:MAG: 30S ribosomal protein S16 [Alphaproteobacteria bacterium]|nr:30S ribosomal protein S16 [Alphaproteobacteria bacterium]
MNSKKRPYYHVVIADSRSPRDGRFLEKVGTYNPLLARDDSNRLALQKERLEYWLKAGAQPTERVAMFMVSIGLISAPAKHDQTKKHLPKAKAQARLKEAESATKEPTEPAAA